jgi:carbon-monoxide dehydrogenase medium subunit
MKPAPFTYHDPHTEEDVVGLLGRLDNARLLAGGQSLMPMMNFRYAMPDHVIDLNLVESLAGIVETANGVRVGAMTRQRDIEFSDIIAARFPVMHSAQLHVGHRQTRNRGTIGGSLCHLDPAAEMPGAMALLDATLHLRGPGSARAVPMAEFAQSFMTTALAPDEMLTAIEITPWAPGHGWAWEEYARRHGDFAIAAVGVLLTLDARGQVSRAAIVISGIAEVPLRLRAGEAMLVGQVPSPALFAEIAELASRSDAMTDAYVTAEYRQHLSGELCRRALSRAAERALEGTMAHA